MWLRSQKWADCIIATKDAQPDVFRSPVHVATTSGRRLCDGRSRVRLPHQIEVIACATARAQEALARCRNRYGEGQRFLCASPASNVRVSLRLRHRLQSEHLLVSELAEPWCV